MFGEAVIVSSDLLQLLQLRARIEALFGMHWGKTMDGRPELSGGYQCGYQCERCLFLSLGCCH